MSNDFRGANSLLGNAGTTFSPIHRP